MKPRLIVALMVLLGMALLGYLAVNSKPVDMDTLCQENLDEGYSELVSLIQTNQGEYLEKDSEGFASFATLFDMEMVSADLRDPNNVIFSFHALQPEVSVQLVYCKDDRLWIQSNTFLTEDTNELRVEHLGITQTGYIYCKRIRQCWFYYEALIPT